MSEEKSPIAIKAADAPARTKPSNYPEPFASRMAGREKRPLGDLFGLTNFGVNLTRLAPSSVSALRHAHSKQDEFIYVLQGRPTLHTDGGRLHLSPRMCAGFKAGTGNGHHLINETAEEVVYIEIGDRTPGDEGTYPDDDLKALQWKTSGSLSTRTARHTVGRHRTRWIIGRRNTRPAETFHDHVDDDSLAFARSPQSRPRSSPRTPRLLAPCVRRTPHGAAPFTRSRNDALDGKYSDNPSAHDIASVLHLMYNRPE